MMRQCYCVIPSGLTPAGMRIGAKSIGWTEASTASALFSAKAKDAWGLYITLLTTKACVPTTGLGIATTCPIEPAR